MGPWLLLVAWRADDSLFVRRRVPPFCFRITKAGVHNSGASFAATVGGSFRHPETITGITCIHLRRLRIIPRADVWRAKAPGTTGTAEGGGCHAVSGMGR